MKTIIKDTIVSILATLVFAVVLCGLYPLVVYLAGHVLFNYQANGSLIESSDHKILGSDWIGQNFTSAKYFHPRPSAAVSTYDASSSSGATPGPAAPVTVTPQTDGYNASSSTGTNLGPTSQKLIDSVKAAVEQYRKDNGLSADILVPGDAVTSSGSGLDPHISVKNALLQAPRVAKERGVGVEIVTAEISKATDGPSLGFLGESGVNVLKLNLALDKIASK
jgi:potassium-transporting ATPase KdpC subunit